MTNLDHDDTTETLVTTGKFTWVNHAGQSDEYYNMDSWMHRGVLDRLTVDKRPFESGLYVRGLKRIGFAAETTEEQVFFHGELQAYRHVQSWADVEKAAMQIIQEFEKIPIPKRGPRIVPDKVVKKKSWRERLWCIVSKS